MKHIPILLALWVVIWALILDPVNAATHLHDESFYAVPFCISVHGINPDGKPSTLADGTKPDCVTEFDVIEVDFAVSKYYECGFQAIHYANQLNKFPVCALITETASECDWYFKAKADFASMFRRIALVNIGPYQCE